MKFDADLRFARFLDRSIGGALARLYPVPRNPNLVKLQEARRILSIKLHGIGNIVMLLPALRALRAAFPEAEIDMLTFSSNVEILDGTREINRCWFLDGETIPGFMRSLLASAPGIRRAGYDIVVDFEQFARISTLISAWTGAPHRIGYDTGDKRANLYSVAVPYREDAHMRKIFLRLPAAAGADVSRVERRIEIADSHLREAAAVEFAAGIGGDAIMAIMHPGSSPNLTLRRWPAERFGQLSALLGKRFGIRTLVTGSQGESELARRVAAASLGFASDVTGRLSAKGLAALCERSEFVISNDTAVVHIASAMGTPVVGLYGPNTPALYGPDGAEDIIFYEKLPCSPCMTNLNNKLSDCRNPLCMEAIGVAAVAEAVEHKYFDEHGFLLKRFKKTREPR